MKIVFSARVWRRGNSLVVTIPANKAKGLKEGDWVAVAIVGPFEDGVPFEVEAKLVTSLLKMESDEELFDGDPELTYDVYRALEASRTKRRNS